MTIAGFLTYLLMLAWGPIGLVTLIVFLALLWVRWAIKRFS